MKSSTACHACRVHRRKCRIKAIGGKCVRCEDLNIDCSLDLQLASRLTGAKLQTGLKEIRAQPQQQDGDETWRRNGGDVDGYGSAQQDVDGNAQQDVSNGAHAFHKELVQHYFRAIHDKHHSLFHRPSVEEDLDNGTLPDILLYAMMALAARFSNIADEKLERRRTCGRDFASKATKLLDMTNPSLTTIQACVLLGTICFSESKTDSEALYYAAATRLAQIMDLPNRPCEDEIQRQVHLRVWWTLYMIDIWSSQGLGSNTPRLLHYRADIPLPAEEILFLSLSRGSTNIDSRNIGIWAAMIELTHIWAEIHDVNQTTVRGTRSPESLNAVIAVLASKLNNWSARLPHTLTETKANFERYAQVGLGSALAALHLGFHYYNEVLFYQFLVSNSHSSAISADYYRQCCRTHAKQFCELLYFCYSTPHCEVVYIMLGHMLVITSTVYIHSLLFSSTEEEISTARHRLEQNFKVLTELQSYWVKLDVSLSRLEAFHHACTVSLEHPFHMDRWLAAFILEHGVALNERFPDGRNADPSVVTQTSDSDSSPGNVQEWYLSTFPAA